MKQSIASRQSLSSTSCSIGAGKPTLAKETAPLAYPGASPAITVMCHRLARVPVRLNRGVDADAVGSLSPLGRGMG